MRRHIGPPTGTDPGHPLLTVAVQGFAASSFAYSQVQYAIALLRLNMAFSPTKNGFRRTAEHAVHDDSARFPRGFPC